MPPLNYPRWALTLLATAQLIIALDATVIFVALHDMGRALQINAQQLQWVVSAYTVAFGGSLLLGGRAADLIGRRRFYRLGMLLFALASLLGALAPNATLLIIARAAQGVGAALLFPATLAGWFGSGESMSWLKDIGATLSPGQPVYVLLYAIAIIFFCFFYTALVFNSKETADNLKKSGAFVPGIRPGEQTARYIDKILTRLTLVGAIYITLVCLLPEFLILKWNVPFHFGGTSLLIIVVVTMDFMAQVQAYVMSHQYEGLLKKANFKNSLAGR